VYYVKLKSIRQLPALLADPDRDKADGVIQAMRQMVKIDIAALAAAATKSG